MSVRQLTANMQSPRPYRHLTLPLPPAGYIGEGLGSDFDADLLQGVRSSLPLY